MLSIDHRQLVHEFLVLDLAVQSLQTDFSKMEQTEQMKMKRIYLPLIDNLLKSVRNDYLNQKRLLAKDKIRVVKWTKIDENFSDVLIATAGEDITLRYANRAIKTHVENMLLSRLNK
ncbi:aconitate hydratase [Solibacillus sp. R5-41]|uniref:aconitate hydratase n=1 Tax=Solibacillus sp. R5-41 TaxID=2048654 RepID=UPI000C127F14|nr:aconitate hydratase [Solibacillus sp. R5-41]ATP40031.1 aconitate hydratase [Solibacillus sp. R5-41]